MSLRFLPLLSFLVLTLTAASAQTSYIFTPEVKDGCDIGSFIVSTSNLDWVSLGCIDAELDASGSVVTLSSEDIGARVFGQSNQQISFSPANQLPGATGSVGLVNFSLTGDLNKLDLTEGASGVFAVSNGPGVTQLIYVDFLNPDLGCGQQIVDGSGFVTLLELQVSLSDSLTAREPVSLGISYTYSNSTGNNISEIIVPESEFNGTTYEHDLPLGSVTVYPSNGLFFVGLENNKPDQQIININKSEGVIAIAGWANVVIQQSTQTNEFHDVRLNLDSVDICLGDSEFIVEEGATLLLGNSTLSYETPFSCLGAHTAGKIVIKEGRQQTLGNEGQGMHLFADNAILEVQKNARLVFENAFYMEVYNTTYLDVASGASVEVSENTSLGSSAQPQSIVVRLQEGGSFDMSRAPQDVQNLFSVQQVSSTQHTMPEGSYLAFPNPAEDGKVFIRSGVDARELLAVEIIDLAGRVRTQVLPTANHGIIPVELPGSGMFLVRMTDIDGRVGHLKVISN